MTGYNWFDESLAVIGMFVSGAPLRSPGPRGEQQVDNSFMVWLNASPESVTVALPANAWVQSGSLALSTAPEHPVGESAKAGKALGIAGRSVPVVMEDGGWAVVGEVP